jgi:nicotinamide mononucleotide transporter
MSALWEAIWSGLTTASPLDQVNLAMGIAGVWLMIRRSLWAFPVGLAAVTVQGVLFYRSRYYADATLQIFFFAALTYGWWHWTRDRGAAPELPVTRLTRPGMLLTIGLAGAGTVAWALVLRKYTDAIMPFRDAFIAAFSVAAQVLQSRKQIDNWPCWVVVNLVAICSYWFGGLYYTTFLYALYLVLAFIGWREWRIASPGRGACLPAPSEGR